MTKKKKNEQEFVVWDWTHGVQDTISAGDVFAAAREFVARHPPTARRARVYTISVRSPDQIIVDLDVAVSKKCPECLSRYGHKWQFRRLLAVKDNCVVLATQCVRCGAQLLEKTHE